MVTFDDIMVTKIEILFKINNIVSTMSCPICTENYNKTIHKEITCVSYECNFTCCKGCVKRYIMSKTENPHCMSCKVAWNREFMHNNFGNVFITKEYKHFRENIIYERELSLMPETQAFMEQESAKEAIKLNLSTQITELQHKLNELKNMLFRINNGQEIQTIQKSKFVRKCPNNTCNGFLSEDFHCSLCNTSACGKCREIVDKNDENVHMCDENILKTINLLEKDSKDCPSCGTTIFKIDGCNQIFCTSCHKAFDWKTLKIENGPIHNPHYFEWLRQNNESGIIPRTPGDVQCGRELSEPFIINFVRKLKAANVSALNARYFVNHMQNVQHIKYVEIPTYTYNRIDDNRDLRIKFLKNEITKDEFKKLLQRREKSIEKKTEFCNILDMYVNCFTDIIYKVREEIDNPTNSEINQNQIDVYKKELENLKLYANNNLKRICEIYNCKEIAI